MTHLATLHEHLTRQQLALFVGGDLPSALTGVPGRAELAAGLARRQGLSEELSLAAVAQRTAQGGNRFGFTDFLGRQLDTQGKQPQEIHRLLALLQVATVMTTGYDDLLERAYAETGITINRVVRNSDLAFTDPRRLTLIKLYGDLQQRDTLVVTEDDHYGLWRNRDKESLLEEVRGIVRRCAVLFVGYNLQDPDFMLLWREVLDHMGRFAVGAYAIAPGMAADEQQVWADRQVRIIDGQPLVVLQQLVGEVGDGRSQEATATFLDEEMRASLVRQLTIHQRNLMLLQEQAAKYGSLDMPLRLYNQLHDEQAIIADLQRRLGKPT